MKGTPKLERRRFHVDIRNLEKIGLGAFKRWKSAFSRSEITRTVRNDRMGLLWSTLKREA